MSSFKTLGLAALALAINMPTALAQNYNKGANLVAPGGEQEKDWQVTVGAGALVLPEYVGADEYEVLPVPYLDVKYKDIVTLNPFTGLRYNAFKHQGFTLGTGLGYDFGRDEDDADRLRGLGDVDGSVEAQLFAQYQHGPISADLTFSQDLSDGHDGFSVEAEAGYIFFLEQYRAIIRPSIGTKFGSDNYMETFFSVNPAQSARSGLSQFDAESGFKEVSANVFASYPLTTRWSLNGLVGYSQLLGDAADSPIVEAEGQFMSGAFIAYEF